MAGSSKKGTKNKKGKKGKVERSARKTYIPSVFLTDRYAAAVEYAAAIHGAQTRKGRDTAYLAHLLGVSSLVIEAGGDETQAIAALLHDAIEDCGGMPRYYDVQARFGAEVAEIVRDCSDSTDEDWKRTVPYRERKRLYLEHLEVVGRRSLLVAIADKVHNARAIHTDIVALGPVKALARFTGTPADIAWYYEGCLDRAEQRSVSETLVVPLRIAVAAISSAADVTVASPRRLR